MGYKLSPPNPPMIRPSAHTHRTAGGPAARGDPPCPWPLLKSDRSRGLGRISPPMFYTWPKSRVHRGPAATSRHPIGSMRKPRQCKKTLVYRNKIGSRTPPTVKVPAPLFIGSICWLPSVCLRAPLSRRVAWRVLTPPTVKSGPLSLSSRILPTSIDCWRIVSDVSPFAKPPPEYCPPSQIMYLP